MYVEYMKLNWGYVIPKKSIILLLIIGFIIYFVYQKIDDCQFDNDFTRLFVTDIHIDEVLTCLIFQSANEIKSDQISPEITKNRISIISGIYKGRDTIHKYISIKKYSERSFLLSSRPIFLFISSFLI